MAKLEAIARRPLVNLKLVLGVQLIKQRPRLLHIERFEAFGEPAIDPSAQFASLMRVSTIAQEPRHAHRCAHFGSVSAHEAVVRPLDIWIARLARMSVHFTLILWQGMYIQPQAPRGNGRINPCVDPPRSFIAAAVNLAVMASA